MNDVNLLMAVLGIPTKPPVAPVTRKICNMFSARDQKYMVSAEVQRQRSLKVSRAARARAALKTDPFTKSEHKIIDLINRSGKISAAEAHKSLGWTQTHTTLIMGAVFRKGAVSRHQVSNNSTRWFVYTPKKETK